MSVSQAAAEFVRRFGWPVFPVRDKRPLVRSWKEDASLDVASFDWSAADGYGIALPEGIVVVDLDVDEHGDVWSAIEEFTSAVEQDDVRTLTANTRRGGLHLYFRCPPVPQAKLGKHVDLRVGGKGYVVGPGSPGYSWATPDPGPDAIAELVLRATPKTWGPAPARATDEAERLGRAFLERYLDNQPSGEDTLRYVLACSLRDLGIAQDRALELLREWNARCRYPRDDRELAKAVTNAYRYAQNEPGEFAPPPPDALVAQVPDDNPLVQARETLARLSLRAAFLSELKDEPPPTWLVEDAIPDEGLTLLYGPPKRGKTFSAVDLACAVAGGKPWLGAWEVARRGPVVYFALEGAVDVRARMFAWQEHYGCAIEDDILLVEGIFSVTNVRNVVEAIGAIVRSPALVVVDTFARAACASGLDENSASDQGRAAAAFEHMGRVLRCPVLAVVHAGKDLERGVRGSNALLAAAEAVISSAIDNNVLTLKVEELRRGRSGRSLAASIVSDGPYPVWGVVADTADGYRASWRQAFLRAVARAVCSATRGAETTSKSDFVERVRGRIPYGQDNARDRVRMAFERELDGNAEFRKLVDAGNNRIALLTERDLDHVMSILGVR